MRSARPAERPFAPRTYGRLARVTARVYLFRNVVNSVVVLGDDADLRSARLALSGAVRQVLANGLSLLGVDAPESM